MVCGEFGSRHQLILHQRIYGRLKIKCHSWRVLRYFHWVILHSLAFYGNATSQFRPNEFAHLIWPIRKTFENICRRCCLPVISIQTGGVALSNGQQTRGRPIGSGWRIHVLQKQKLEYRKKMRKLLLGLTATNMGARFLIIQPFVISFL